MFGAAFVVFLVRKLPRRSRPIGQVAIAGVMLATAGWGIAYMNVYAATNPQIAASRWIYSHIKANTLFATEGEWDRSLPFCLPQPGQCPPGYNSYQLNLYSPDDQRKLRRLVYAATHDQYIVMSTQRFVDSIPRVPGQYPMTSRYYQLLFNNQLGFRLVKRFAVHPQLGPWVIDDFPADENFTVFDHPDVRIFRRVKDVSVARVRRLILEPLSSGLPVPQADGLPPAAAKLTRIDRPAQRGAPSMAQRSRSVSIRVTPPRADADGLKAWTQGIFGDFDARARDESAGGASGPPPVDYGAAEQDARLMLDPAQWGEDQRSPTYDQMFPPNGFGMTHPVLVWLAVVELMGLALVPAAFLVFRGLRDRGWIIAKTLGLIVPAWITWIIVALGWVPYDRTTIYAVMATVVFAGGLLWWAGRKTIRTFLWRHWRGVAMSEAVFLAGFALFVLLRMWYPDLGHQFSPVSPANAGAGRMGEKQLELAFLNAISRSRTFPPMDPFFSGGFINYYYFGYLLVATLCKATTIAPSTGFNLAIPTFFALLVGTSYAVGRALTRSPAFGLITAVFAGCLGNLNGLVQLVQAAQSNAVVHMGVPVIGGAVELLSGLTSGQPFPAFDFWAGTRLVPPVGIDFAEFPYFTYLFGDLHAHLMAMPMDLALVALSLSVSLSFRKLRAAHVAGAVAMGALLLGAVEATNPPDFPTYVAVLFVGFAIAVFAVGRDHPLRMPRLRQLTHRVGHSRELVAAGERMPTNQDAPRQVAEPSERPMQYAATGRRGARNGVCDTPIQLRAVITRIGVAGALVASTAALGVLLFPPIVQGYHPVFNTGLATVGSQAASVRAALAAGTPPIRGNALKSAVHDAVVTPLPIYWEIFGLFLFILLSWLSVILCKSVAWRAAVAPVWRLLRNARTTDESAKDRERGWGMLRSRWATARFFAAGLAVAGVAVLAALDLWLLAFLLAVTIGGVMALVPRRGRRSTVRSWIGGLMLIALGLSAFCEIFFVPDYLSGSPAFRMNTVAKAYTDIWVLYAVAAAGALGYLTSAVRLSRPRRDGEDVARRPLPSVSSTARSQRPRWPRGHSRWPVRTWGAVLAAGLFGALIYTFAGTVARETYRQTWLPEGSVPFTLDGMAFMRRAYPEDYAAIGWMNAHIKGTPTILEADHADYNWRSRVVQFTGLPTLFGGIYEPAQRYGDEVAPRQSALEEIYGATAANVTPAIQAAFHVNGCTNVQPSAVRCVTLALLSAYHVSYVYVGSMERQLWPAGVRKFAHMPGLALVFHRGKTSLYHVNGSET
jgi:uncharacterized membrane protein